MFRLSKIILFIALLSSAAFAQEVVSRGPYLQQISDSQVIIQWRTDIAVGSAVRFGIDLDNLDTLVESAPAVFDHSVKLDNLNKRTRYYYMIGKPGAVSTSGTSSQTFRTAPAPNETTRAKVWVIGDSGTADANAGRVRDAYQDYTMMRGDSDFMIMLGDNAYNTGTDPEYQNAVFDTYPEILLKTPVWSTLGNHDGSSASSATQSGPYYDIFTLPTNGEIGGLASGTEAYYSFDYGNIHFVCLNSYDVSRSANSPMLQWLRADLDVNDKEWLIAFFHHPPYTKGSHDSDLEGQLIEMRENALPILEAAGVDLVLSGHSHSYERSFFIDGHYGLSSSFNDSLKKDLGNGSSDGAYSKLSGLVTGNAGAVYAVAGSSGRLSGGALNHPAMQTSLAMYGSLVLEFDDKTLDVIFLDDNSITRDSFQIRHESDLNPPVLTAVRANSLTEIEVEFDKSVQQASAETLANYQVSAEINVLSASLSLNKKVVTLSVEPLSLNAVYALYAANILDVSGNSLADNSYGIFSFVASGTIAFQHSVLPTPAYSGVFDTTLSQNSSTTNAGSSTFVAVDGDDPGGSTRDLKGLLRWDISEVPVGAIVTDASISIFVTNISSEEYFLYPLLRDWSEAEATWNLSEAASSWEVAGVNGSSDREPLVSASIRGVALGEESTVLNAAGVATINSWVLNPLQNFGFVLANSGASNGLDFYSSEATIATNRPKLILQYETGAGAGDTSLPNVPLNLNGIAQSMSTVSLSWDAASDDVGVIGYALYRNSELIEIVSTTSYLDTGLASDTEYQYYIIALDAAANQSVASSILSVRTLLGDRDGDGVLDTQEAVDGTNPNDSGSVLRKLAQNSCTEWNGFLSMYNFLELINRTASPLSVDLELFTINGSLGGTFSLRIPAFGQWDQPVHEMTGFEADSYGLLCVSHSASVGSLAGQMALYRPKNGGFEFAMALPLANGTKGTQVVGVNTFNPNASLTNALANWIQIANFSSAAQSGVLRFFAQDGSLLAGGEFNLTLDPKARVDIAAHQFGLDFIGSAEWEPSDPEQRFSLRGIRYVYDNPSFIPSFVTAAPIVGRQGTGERQFAPVSLSEKTAVLELVNSSSSFAAVEIEFRKQSGELASANTIVSLPAHGTSHLLLNQYFTEETPLANVSIKSSAVSSLVATVLEYQRNSVGLLELMYAVPAREAVSNKLYASYNTYISHENELLLVSSVSTAQSPALTLKDASGNTLSSQSLNVSANAALSNSVNTQVMTDRYGGIELDFDFKAVTSWLLRRGGNEYVIPFELQP